jgi:hypothetical protein
MMMDEKENQSSLGMIWTSDSTTFYLEKHILVGDDFIPSAKMDNDDGPRLAHLF